MSALPVKPELTIFVLLKGVRQGPYSAEQLKDFVGRGDISPTDMAWHEGCTSWHPINEMPEFVDMIIPPLPEEPVPLRFLVKVDGAVRQPLTIDELQVEVANSRISLSNLGQQVGTTEWIPLHAIPAILDLILPPMPGAESCAGAPHPERVSSESTPPVLNPINKPPRIADFHSIESATRLTTRPNQGANPTSINAPPTAADSVLPSHGSESSELASRRSRLFAQLADFLVACLLGSLLGVLGVLLGGSTFQVGYGFTVVSLGTLLLMNSILLGTRGQTPGKMLFHVKIVDAHNGKVGGVRVVFLRYLSLCLLCLLSKLGLLFGILYCLAIIVDSLCIFRRDRRCLHDFLARTVVVQNSPHSV